VNARWAAALLVVLGCAQRAAGPASSVEAYAAAVERRDYAGAYALMSSSFRQRVSPVDFQRQLAKDAGELAADAKSVRDSADRWGARVEVTVPGDERVPLVRESGSWRLEAPPFEPYGQSTPRAAVRAFVRAVENRRYDVLLRLAPTRFRSSITIEKLRAYWEGEQAAQNRALLKELRQSLGARIAEEGDEAFMTYGSNRQVRFVREEGLWRIENPE
jgi:hypothetical protein